MEPDLGKVCTVSEQLDSQTRSVTWEQSIRILVYILGLALGSTPYRSHHSHVLALSSALPDATIITVAGEDTYVE